MSFIGCRDAKIFENFIRRILEVGNIRTIEDLLNLLIIIFQFRASDQLYVPFSTCTLHSDQRVPRNRLNWQLPAWKESALLIPLPNRSLSRFNFIHGA